jgi:hypothetical protein
MSAGKSSNALLQRLLGTRRHQQHAKIRHRIAGELLGHRYQRGDAAEVVVRPRYGRSPADVDHCR